MKVIIVALAIVAVVAALPVEKDVVAIIRSNFDRQPEGNYAFEFEAENGIQRVENGEVKEVLDEENKPHKVVVVRGSYTYKDDSGNTETVNYFADENGYHAEGPSIPKNPARR